MKSFSLTRLLRVLAPLTAGALFLSLATSASAHAHLASAIPAPGASVPTTPSSVAITFDDNLDKTATKITVLGPGNTPVDNGQTVVSASNPMVATVGLKGAGTGVYTVKWHSVADDDKGVVEGTFSFGVGIPASAVPTAGAVLSIGSPPLTDSLQGTTGGAAANYSIQGDGTVWNINFSYTPGDPISDTGIGFLIYDESGNVVTLQNATGNPPHSVTWPLRTMNGMTYQVQVFAYMPLKIQYTIGVSQGS